MPTTACWTRAASSEVTASSKSPVFFGSSEWAPPDSPTKEKVPSAALLAEARSAYRDLAGFDIAENPGVLATLYQLGSPTVRARRLAEENEARRARGERIQPPQVNAYGAFVNRHADQIAAILGAAAAPAELRGR